MNGGIIGVSTARLIKASFAILAAMFFVCLIAVFSLSSHPAQADSVDSDISLNIGSAIAVSLENCDASASSTINIKVMPTPNGTFKSACQTATIDTNAPGYSLTAKASDSALNYLNPTNIDPVPTIPSTTALHSAPAALTNNTWGFAAQERLGFVGNTYEIDNAANPYAQLPIAGVTVYKTDVFPAPVKSHTFYYGTKLDTETIAGTYATTITYTAIGADIPQPEFTQSYTTGSRLLFVTSDTIIQPGSKIYVGDKECTNVAYTSLTTATCNTPANAKGFHKITITPPPAYTGTMQNWNGCSNLNIGDVVILNDNRNNQSYRVRKMEDGKCWMIDNMKLAGVTLTPTNSNVMSNYDLMAISSTHGTVDDTPYVDDPALNSTYKNNCLYNMGISEDSLTGCGYLYSWSAATAGTGDGIRSGNASGSICPAGWRLPTGAPTGEFAVLNGSMLNGAPSSASTDSTDTSRANWWSTGPFSGSYAGYFRSSTWSDQGRDGYWWSSTASSTTNAYHASVNYSSLEPGTTNLQYQYSGYSVRCLL